ncbi:MAG: ABC transporter ATP-binding protein [Flavobacteriales bacterium]
MIFEAKNISKSYHNHVALNDVSLEVEKQSIFGLLGPNGAGKTSLIRIVNQITAPDSGEIIINGEKLSPKHIEDIGYLPEERGLYKKMQIGEQAMYLAQLKGMSKNDAKRELKLWFEKFEIGNWWNKKVEELSKGMAQKVQFITTVLHKPKILILDEPFSGFDPINANLIKSEIMQLKEEGATIFLSTHNMGSVEEICDNIALINSSKKVLDGKVSDIKKEFSKNMYEIDFKGNMIGFANALWTNFELIEKESFDNENHRATVKILGDNSLNNLLSTLIKEDVQLKQVNEIIPTMSEIFIEVVEKNNELIG